MKRFVTVPLLSLFLGAMLLSAGCGNNQQTTTDISQCLGDIALQVVATLADGEALTVGKLISSAGVCIDAAIAFFSAPANANPSTPEVDINSSSTDSSFSGSVQSSSVQNCTDYPVNVQINFYVPFEMLVGPQGNQATFETSPGGSGDNELIAQQLFQQYGSYIAGHTTSGASQSEVYTIGPHTQAVFTLPIELYYKSGEGRVVHTDGSTVSMPWFFTDNYQQSGQITYTTSSC